MNKKHLIQRHIPLLYGSNLGISSFRLVNELSKKYTHKKVSIKNFKNEKVANKFISRLQKRYFRRFREPIFAKFENNGKQLIYWVNKK